MTVRELNKSQLEELKRYYVCETMDNPSWNQIVNASDISNETIFNYYDGIDFVEDDFFCSC